MLRHDVTPEQIVSLLNVMVCRPGARFDDPLTTVMLDGLTAPGAAAASALRPQAEPE
ncbi:hypothetical protein ABZ897_43990 [Nonomuraea sp. NPDC046802]|uniref:hypothetical protein n=1 Tax=Nonomuraea sp. NPDC046802 TaxID=3154919 RepID=UPI0034075CB0